MFTLDNTDGFSAGDLARMNQIVADIIAHLGLDPDRWEHLRRVEEAVGQTFDPNLSNAENENWALERLAGPAACR